MSDNNSDKSSRKALLGRILIVFFMLSVIVAECAVAYFWIPNADALEARVEDRISQDQAEAAENQDKKRRTTVPCVEMDLGKFSLSSHLPAADTTLRIDCHLVAEVIQEKKDRFEKLYTHNQHRIRDAVVVEMRRATPEELTEPGLGLIKRRILAKSNDLLGETLIRGIVISEFSYIHQ